VFITRPTLQGTFGMASSTHWLASATAMAVLEDGGNAFDAAVAAGFVLNVVEPHLNGPGGEVPVILAPVGGPVRVLCGQGPAPAGAAAFSEIVPPSCRAGNSPPTLFTPRARRCLRSSCTADASRIL